MIFTRLPFEAKKALIQYFALDSDNEEFEAITATLPTDELSIQHWELLVEHADFIWSDTEYSLSCLPIDKATDFIMEHSPDLLDEHGSFDVYHADYCKGRVPSHKDNGWPVLAMPSCDEALLDGWHRLHSYVRSGHSEIYFINLDDVSEMANSQYLVPVTEKAA